MTYAYDDASKLTGITQSSATVGFTYDASSRRTKLQLPNGIDVDYGYDDAGQLASLTYKQGSTTLGDLAYTYNEAGQRTAIGGSYARTNLPAAVASTTHDANNRVTNWGGTAFTYDDNGNLTSDGTRTYTWDVRNRLSSLSGGASASFTYDATGRRQSKTVSGTTTKFLYDGLNVIQELDGSLTPTANLLTGLGIDETFIRTDSAARYVLPDALGSTVALTDGSAATRTSYTYEPYGETTTTGDASTNAFQYTGRENDNTGLYYYRARYYQPGIKRFVSEDPIGLIGGPNLYAYVGGNPISYTDPKGLEVTVWSRPVDIGPGGVVGWLPGANHYWIKTDTYEAGMGPWDPNGNGQVPGQEGRSDMPGDPTQTVDHTGQSEQPNARRIPLPWPVVESCINRCIRPGQATGAWTPQNQCKSFVNNCLQSCRKPFWDLRG